MSNSFLDLFGSSPIKPMQDHMDTCHRCAKTLADYFAAALANDWPAARDLQAQIQQLENDADDLKRNLRLHLPKGLFLPVARTDLLALLSRQDRIANRARDIAGVMTGREMSFPDSLHDNLTKFLTRSIEASAQAHKAIHELDELVVAGFRGREAALVEDMINKLDEIENDTDDLQRSLRSEVFSLEADLPPVDVIFIYKIIEWIGDLANDAQSVGSRLEMLIAR